MLSELSTHGRPSQRNGSDRPLRCGRARHETPSIDAFYGAQSTQTLMQLLSTASLRTRGAAALAHRLVSLLRLIHTQTYRTWPV